MTKKAYLQQEDMFMKLSMARASSQHVWINYNNLGKIEQHVNILPLTFYSKSRARLRHARALHNCKKGAWMDREHLYDQNIFTEVSQNKHGSHCSIKFTWHQNNSRKRTQQKPKSLETATSPKPSLHACASHHIDHKNARQTPL